MRPEYIPKHRSPPSGTEGVLQVLQLIVNNTDTVKTIHIALSPESVHPDPRRFHYFPPLGAGDRFERAPERRAAPGFDLDEGNQLTSSGHQVQLDSADAKAMGNDVPATALEKPNRVFFTGEAALVPRIGPIRGIAMNAA